MKPENLEAVYRLSPSQEGILFHTLYEPASSLYFLQLAVRVRGRLDAGLLRRAWEDLAARHSALRTAIHWQGLERPVQVVSRKAALPWREEDWRDVPEEELEESLARFREADRERGFDLSEAPLLRLTLIRAAGDLHFFVWSFHHIVVDGWCLPILFREVFELYTAGLRGEAPRLPPARPYRDYIAWLQRQDPGASEAFWREHLAGFSAPTPLAAGLPAVPGGAREFAEREAGLSPELSAALSGLARRHRLTPSTLLTGAWGLLLGRYADQEDVVFGATFSGRSAPLPGLESMVGLFINTLPVRVRLPEGAALGPWLQEIRDRHAQLVAREHAPLVQVQGWSEVPRGVPLFESLLVLENYPMDRAAGDLARSVPFTLEMDPIASENNYPLALVVFAGERFLLRLKHETRRFDGATAARLLDHLESLLEGMATASEDLALRGLPMLREAERRQLLEEGQEPAPEPREAAPLPALFARQVERAPEAVAVVHEGRSWTYRQLDDRANRIARALLARGVRPGDAVALCLERSEDLLAAILGVLKTGAAYVPIDPVHPEERRRHVLADSGAVGLVTGAATEGLRDLPEGVWELSLDREAESLAAGSAEAPRLDLSPDLPAYAIYTSGSTGRPKGVLVTHRNVARLFAAAGERFDFGPGDVWTLFHSPAFDFSVWEMWGALLHGGRLVVVPYWTSRSPRDFDALLRREGVTVLNQTPSAFLAWMAEEGSGGAGDGLALRWVIFGGEALEPASLAPWFERHGDQSPRLVNMYGITETTVHVTWQPLTADRAAGGSVVGRPLPGWRAHLLSRGMEPLPAGVPGEIFVGGDGVAAGYLGQPEKTAERFVPDPFAGAGAEPGARLYRSGDLARRLPGGALEFLGRIDRQVKVRGFRIELGEIEAALARHPALREAVVEARRDRAGEPVLVAYAVPAPGEAVPDLADLRAFLARSLPEHMLPGALVPLPALPLTANGKVDRRALPEPEAPRGEPTAEPQTPLETFLAGLWRETLSVEPVGLHDDFFTLGGSSISGARLINRLQKHLGEIVHVVAIFDAPTVARLARYLSTEHREAVARVWGQESLGEAAPAEAPRAGTRVDEEEVTAFRRLFRPRPVAAAAARNPSAVFVLSPPRSGSTLLRVLLAGHPRLFAPPELELLSFATLAERRSAFSGRDAFWQEGLLRAVMEARGSDAETARETVSGWEEEGLDTLAACTRLQALLGGRRLVDKTPSYALVPGALERAEAGFSAPFYIHLVRHPAGMIHSFEEAKLDQLLLLPEHSCSRRELAELIWVVSHRNILDHLAAVPPERQARVRFEDLVTEPERTLRSLCERLGLDFDPAMARPYEDLGRRMADGLHADSRMLGDVKLSEHCKVDPETAERWRAALPGDFLGSPARGLAVLFGYEAAPLSFSQERLWFLDRLAPGSPAYNIPVAVRLTGQLDVHALSASLREIVRRHAVLRTRFEEEDGRPVQRVEEAAELPLPVVDLTSLPAPRREEEARRLAMEEASRGFDLSRGPLLRARLLRLDGREHAALFTMHHIVSDGWSMGVLVREVGALYAAFTAGRPSPLPRLPLQYVDFARWQRADPDFSGDLVYWRRRLDGAPAALALPADRPRPAVATGEGGERAGELPTRAVAPLARGGTTPFMVLLAAWKALLHRLTGEPDLRVGTPVANRNRAELEGLIGFFVNTLVLRTEVSAGDLPFRALVERVRKTAVGAFAHQNLPFEKLVEALAPERSLAHTPLFQVMFSLQNAPFEPLSLSGLALAPFPLESPAAKFDLSLLAVPQGERIALSLTFSRDLFDATTAERLLRAYATLVAGAASHPEARVSDLPLLAEAERAQFLREWSDPTPPPEALVPELFRRRAERTPDAVAVRQGETALSYRELAQQAGRLSRALSALGVGPEVRVGLFLDRSPGTVAALLGVLSAGGGFVPLDPELPAERLAFLLEDAGAARVLTTERLLGALPATSLSVHRIEDLLAPGAAEAPPAPAVAEAAAYVLYTSGSTGRPKGAVVGHRSLASYLSWVSGFLAAEGVRALPALSRLSFDAFLKQLLAPLLHGGEVWLLSPETAGDPDRLLAALGSREGTAFNGVPALWRTLVERIEAGVPAPRTLRAVLLGGDRVAPELVARTAAALPQAAIWNLYGPTEATANATAGRLASPGTPSLGRPAAGARVRLLDRGLEPLPAGLPGELCLGGPGLARGYRGLPALTAERFVPDPFGAEPGGRLYRTGDRARLRADGALEFLGRLDGQLKVRGVRLEPGEVEAALASHPSVREAVVGTRRGPDGEEALAAWLVPQRPEAPPTLAELQEHLRRRLPEALVPSWLIPVEALARTASGKVDRAALPDPQTAAGAAGLPLPALRSPAEEMLLGIWEDLFQRAGISPADDFFALGGHSLLAVRLASRVRDAFGLELPLRAVFEHPTAAGLAAVLDARARGSLEPEPPIARAPRHGRLPLSFPQQRLWILDRIEPGSPVYNMPLPLLFEGELDERALARALGEVVRRHEVLRTRFAAGPGGEPEQIVEPPAPFVLPRVDLRGLPEPAREAELRRLGAEEALSPFDLGRAPMLRATLVDLAGKVLLLTLHHIAADGASLEILEREASVLYAAFRAGAPSPLPEPEIQYADYAAWQRRPSEEERRESLTAWWRERLRGAAPFELPPDRPRPAAPSHRGGRVPLRLSPEGTAALRDAARQQGATLFMAGLAAFQALLSRMSGSEDGVLGSPTANRDRREIEGLIGFFVNMLVLRGTVHEGDSFASLLRKVRETALGAYAHRELPFERLVEALHPERDPGRNPLFQIVFQLIPPAPAPGADRLGLRRLELPRGTTQFDLGLSWVDDGRELQGALEYAADLYDPSTVTRFAERLVRLLEGVAADPEAALARLSLLSAAEEHQVLREWNDTGGTGSAGALVHRLFEERAAANPGAVALLFGEESVTYGELNRRANRLAHHLRRRGAGPETPVAVLLERSPEQISAFLAILKAGSAYVPIDPAYPHERIALLLADLGSPVVIASAELRELVPAGPEAVDPAAPLPGESEENPEPGPLTGASLAYVVYTSGSTGRPKGVAAVHEAVVRLVRGRFAGLGPDQVFLHLSPPSFDASTLEIWAPLTNGGRLAIYPSRTPTIEELAGVIARHGVTTAWLTAGLFRVVVDRDLDALRPLRQILTGGDVVPLPQALRVLAELPGCRLLNGYGPTENTTFTTVHPLSPADARRGSVPIGRPIGEGRVAILDGTLAPVPAGVPGELYAGGLGLARGYFGRPDLTAERFLPDPVAETPGERLYRTGDLARWLPDGSVEFLGRIDAQAKIRGFRIEPGEVEAALAAHPGVEAAAVAVRSGPGGDKRLVAWFVPRGGEVSAADLKASLQQSLPGFMVPAAFVPLPALPLTANGKVDRAALPEPSGPAESAGASPRTPAEEVLAAIWRELLVLPSVTVEDDFFALGGHSLLAIQLVSRVREACGVEIPLRALFERPTLAAMAEEVESALRDGGGRETPPIVPAGRDEPLPLSFAQQRLWILDQMEVELTAYNLPLAVRLAGRLDPEALRVSLGEIVRRHEALRTGFGWRDGNPVQEINPWDEVSLPAVDLSGLPEERRHAEAMRLAGAEAARPFELEWDPLLRLALLVLGPGEHVLLATLHHIIADGWSLGVLVRELSALYPAVLEGRPSPLPDLPVQYADYAVWQRRTMAGEALARELAWWRRYLEGAPVLDLPTDRPHRSVATFEGGSRAAALPREAADGLAALCRAEKVTPFMALLGAWVALLARYSGQADVVVGSPVANRDRLETEGLIGFFVNTLVLRARTDGDPDGRGLLSRVRESVLGAFAHQELPFQKLVEELQPERSLQRSPFFQVFFTLQNAPVPPAALPGLTLEALPVDSGSAKFELTLAAVEREDGWLTSIEHNLHLFDATTAERMLRHFGHLLSGLVADPARALPELPLLSPPERHQLVHEWNDTRWGDWEGSLVHRVFEARAAERPDAAALLDRNRRLTYGELERQANRLARGLRRLGVGPEVAVGVYLDSSPELVLAYLAVLKAGGAYVPLSPAYPRDRLELMIEETAAPVVLTRDGLRANAPGGARVLSLEGDAALWADEDEGSLPGGATGDGLAYVMYTSGSTGRPKGVAVVHEAIVRLVRDSGFAAMTADDVFLQITAVSFDVSTFEIWGALLNGARLAFLSSPALSLEELGDAVTRHGVTILWLTTGLFGLMVDRRLEDLRPVRQLLAGGDVLPVPQVRRVVEELPGTRMINGYGPTENTTFTTWRTVSAADAARPSIPIGGPIGHTRVHVLDADLRPVPVGVRGELYTGGLGLARGYFGRPDLTAERFVPDPLAERPGERLYRTGDFARWLPGGGLEFLGRRDVQVKIRGFRIELGEIETVLGRHPSVAEAVVVAREDRPGDRRLVAYLVPAAGATPAAADLQAFLRRSLPDYMVPAAFVLLDALPLTANAKVDRAALPAPEDAARESQASYVPPRNALERAIVTVWEEVLGKERIGVHDNFFDLGGHSLLLLQAASRLNESLGRDLPRGLMFEHPTVAALARALSGGEETEKVPAAALERSQERAAARRESLRQRRRAADRPAVAEEEDGELWEKAE